jgi:lipopolysaccharide biosynthesis glycosyltransferase
MTSFLPKSGLQSTPRYHCHSFSLSLFFFSACSYSCSCSCSSSFSCSLVSFPCSSFNFLTLSLFRFHPLAIPRCGLLEVRTVDMSRFPIKLYQAKVSRSEKRFIHPLNILHHIYTAKIYPDLPRVIVIDTDTLVVADVANLWEEIDSKSNPNLNPSNLTDSITSSPTSTYVWGLNHTQLFGGTFTTLCKKLRLLVSNNSLPSPDAQFTDDTHFHSTGVLVMNIAAWVEFSVVEKIEMFMLHAIYSDIPGGSLLDLGVTRPLLNCYFAGVFNDFATKWNSQAGCHSTNPNAGILHWAGDDKPWTSGCPAPLWAQEEKLLRQSLSSS